MRSTLSHLTPQAQSPLPSQLYCVYAFSKVGEPLVSFLQGLGLNCSNPQNHQSQGVISTVIFFENVYLELYWFDEKNQPVQSDMTAEFNFIARANWQTTRASPFGLGLCYPADHPKLFNSTTKATKTKRSQRAKQLLPSLSGDLGNFKEVGYHIVSAREAAHRRANKVLATSEQIVHQSLGMRNLTHLKLKRSSDRDLSTTLLTLVQQNLITIEQERYPLLELIFDDGKQKSSLDLRPLMPIVLRY